MDARDTIRDLLNLVDPAQARPARASFTRTRRTIPDPQTGHPLAVAAVDVSDRSVCPACTQLGAGAYVSFVSDLRLAFACPSCRKLVWVSA